MPDPVGGVCNPDSRELVGGVCNPDSAMKRTAASE